MNFHLRQTTAFVGFFVLGLAWAGCGPKPAAQTQTTASAPVSIEREFYMMGRILRPGVYQLPSDEIALRQAIAMAGPSESLKLYWLELIDSDLKLPHVPVQEILDGAHSEVRVRNGSVLNFYAPFPPVSQRPLTTAPSNL
jgi:hypothetical protein